MPRCVQIFFGLMLAMFLSAINQTIVATAMPTIGRDFNDFENLPWIVTAYLLTSTAAAPLYGKLSDIYGRRAMMMMAIAIFTLGSIACGWRPNMLTCSFWAAGCRAPAAVPFFRSHRASSPTLSRRASAAGIRPIPALSGSRPASAGRCWAAFIAEHFHWSLVFWFNVPLGVVAAWLAHVQLSGFRGTQRKHKLDWLGAALMMAAAIPLLLALTWGGAQIFLAVAATIGVAAADRACVLGCCSPGACCGAGAVPADPGAGQPDRSLRHSRHHLRDGGPRSR